MERRAEKYQEASREFTIFIDTDPENDLVSAAYSYRGDIEGIRDAVNETDDPLENAIADYRMALKLAKDVNQASYAVFQCVKAYELLNSQDGIIDIMDEYLNSYPDGDIAKATYWKGNAYAGKGDVEQARRTYIEAIEKYGSDTTRDGVDVIIMELPKFSTMLNEEQKARLVEYLEVAISNFEQNKDENQALQYRLRTAKALLVGGDDVAQTEDYLYSQITDYQYASPLVLGMLCEAAIRAGDVAKMNGLYDEFMKRFEDSDFAWKGFKAKTYAFLAEKRYDDAITFIDAAFNFFGAAPFMDWAQVRKASALMELGKYAEAYEAYEAVQGVREWRVSAHPESQYGMGKSLMQQGDYKKAMELP